MEHQKLAPRALQRWFLVHFVADTLFAVPMMIAPVWLLTTLGWQTVDPGTTRLVAAALFGIGIESLIMRRAPLNRFGHMLELKVIWSATAILGLGLSLIEGAQGRPIALWLVFLIFVFFNVLWVYWLVRVRRLTQE